MTSFGLFSGLIILVSLCTADGVRLTLDPTDVVIGGGSNNPNNPNPIPTTTTQQLTMDCTPDGTVSIDRIYSLYMKRKRTQDYDYIIFATIDSGENRARLLDNAPQDIRNKNPSLDGQINNNNIYSSYLRVQFMISSLDCEDGASYQCEINYLPINGESGKQPSNNQDLRITVLPGDLQIQAAMFDGFFANPIQNLSYLQQNSQYEFTCTGQIGMSQNTLIEWYYKAQPFELNMFQQVILSNPMDSIDNGNPTTAICPYTRTAKLRYTPNNQNYDLIMRCDIRTQTNTGLSVTAMSDEFRLRTTYTSGSRKTVYQTVLIVLMMLVVVMAVRAETQT